MTVICADAALGEELKLTRSAKSGVESGIAYSRSWDRNCNALPNTVTITKQPMNGEVSVVQGVSTIPASTPASGESGNCAGKSVTGNQIMYKSKAGFQGTDLVAYDAVGGGKTIATMITIDVK
jgi:hypothetical protein